MSDMKYLDFDLVIEPSGEGYTARGLSSPVGSAAAAFTSTFSDLEIENFLLRVGRSRHVVRRIESPEMASAKAFMMAAIAAVVPASPAPLTPSGLVVAGTGCMPSRNIGRSSARGMA